MASPDATRKEAPTGLDRNSYPPGRARRIAVGGPGAAGTLGPRRRSLTVWRAGLLGRWRQRIRQLTALAVVMLAVGAALPPAASAASLALYGPAPVITWRALGGWELGTPDASGGYAWAVTGVTDPVQRTDDVYHVIPLTENATLDPACAADYVAELARVQSENFGLPYAPLFNTGVRERRHWIWSLPAAGSVRGGVLVDACGLCG